MLTKRNNDRGLPKFRVVLMMPALFDLQHFNTLHQHFIFSFLPPAAHLSLLSLLLLHTHMPQSS